MSNKFPYKTHVSIIGPGRAFRHKQFSPKLLLFFLIPFLFNLFSLLSLSTIFKYWQLIFDFFLAKLGILSATTSLDNFHIHRYNFFLPYPDLIAPPPDLVTWSITLFAVLIISFSLKLITDNYFPLKYILIAILFVQITSLFYFYLFPASFPQELSNFAKHGLYQIILLIFLTPWLFAFTYYIVTYTVLKKILITLMTLCFFSIAAPFQYMLTSYIIAKFSLLFMPIIYIFFGVLPDILIIICFYAYGMSLE